MTAMPGDMDPLHGTTKARVPPVPHFMERAMPGDMDPTYGTTSARLPPVPHIIERIGMGPAQVVFGVLGGFVWFADGSEAILITTAAQTVAHEWGVNDWQRGMLVSIVFAGVLLGNGVCGPFADYYGRRVPILTSYTGISVFGLLSSLSTGYGMLCLLRLFVGLSFGVGQPAVNAMITEVAPMHWRIPMMGAVGIMFSLGEMYGAALVGWDARDFQQLDWRWLFAMGAVPSSLGLALSAVFLQQSPVYLANVGQYCEAKEALSWMNRLNGKRASRIDFQLPSRDTPRSWYRRVLWQPISLIFSRKYCYSTITIVYTTFMLNIVYYGCLYAFPQIFAVVDMGISPAKGLLQGAMSEIPGTIISVVLCMWVERKPTLKWYCLSLAICLWAFGSCATLAMDPDVRRTLRYFSFIGIKLLPSVGFTCAFQYATEVYPTHARATGAAMCLSGGRMGAIFAPVLFESMLHYTGGFTVFFYTLAAAQVLNALLVVFLPFETFGKHLPDDDDAPLISGKA